MAMPLNGIKILDLTRLLPGPFATQLLADLGADLLKIENPNLPDFTRMSPPYINNNIGAMYLAINRNKKSMRLNLKKEEGKYIFYQLVQDYDVIIEGFRPGVTQRLGIDYESVRKLKTEIIYCSLSGYGQTGPYLHKTGHDLNYYAEAGYFDDALNMGIEPPFPLPLVPIGDIAGATTAVIGILSAIIHYKQTGQGQYIDTSIFESLVSWLNGSLNTIAKLNPNKSSNLPSSKFSPLSGRTPYYTVYKAKDGYITIGAIEEHFWLQICEALDRPQFILEHLNPKKYNEILTNFQKIFLKKTVNEWLKILPNACVAPVKSLSSLSKNKQLIARKMLPTFNDPFGTEIRGIGLPIKFSNMQFEIKDPPVEGQHTNLVLQHLGYSSDQITELQEKKVI